MSKSAYIQINKLSDDITLYTKNTLNRRYKEAVRAIDLQMADMYKKFADQKGILNYADMMKYHRLDSMMQGINQELYSLTGFTAKATKDAAITSYMETYYRSGFVLEKTAMANLSFTMLDPKIIQASIENPISGLKLSEILERNRSIVVSNMKADITRGLIIGESYPKMANRITNVLDGDNIKAMRVVRTEVHRNTQQAALASAEHAQKLGLDLEFVWVANLDDRTRDDHALMDGQVAEIENGVPLFRLPDGVTTNAPGMTGYAIHDINCRCILQTRLKKYRPEFRRIKGEGVVPYKNYDEWAKEKGIRPKLFQNKKLPNLNETVLTKTLADRIESLRAKEQLGLVQHEDITKLGDEASKELFANEMKDLEVIKDAFKELRPLEKELANLRVIESTAIKNTTWYKKGMSSSRYTEVNYKRDLKILDETTIKIAEIKAKIAPLGEAIKNYRIKFDYFKNDPDVIKNFIGNYRKVGYASSDDIAKAIITKSGDAKEAVQKAFGYYPTDWINSSIDRGGITTRSVARGFYRHADGTVAISGYTNTSRLETAIHELGHRFERTSGILKYEKEFYEYRTAGDKLQWLGSSYSKSEKSRFDNWMDRYSGKDYGGSAYEVVSMGFQKTYMNPVEFYVNDPEHFNFSLGLLLYK